MDFMPPGEAGCGKTALVHGLLGVCDLPHLSLRCSDLYSKYLGDSEALLRATFREARAVAPGVLVLDEVDAVAYKRQFSTDAGATSGVNERLLSTLLNELDGVEGGARVLVLACTSAPHLLDEALLRPGRLDVHLYVPKPGPGDRLAILQGLTQQQVGIQLDASVSLPDLVALTAGFTGADLGALLREAYMAHQIAHPDPATRPPALPWPAIRAAVDGILEGWASERPGPEDLAPSPSGWWMVSREGPEAFAAFQRASE